MISNVEHRPCTVYYLLLANVRRTTQQQLFDYEYVRSRRRAARPGPAVRAAALGFRRLLVVVGSSSMHSYECTSRRAALRASGLFKMENLVSSS